MNWQEWQQNANAKRKTMILAGAVATGLLWLMWGGAIHMPFAGRSETRPLEAKPASVGITGVPVGAPPVAAKAAPAVPTGDASVPGIRSISGVWQGQGIIPERSGSCHLTVEIRDNP